MNKLKKQSFYAFINSFFLTEVIIFCVLGGLFAAAAAYEGIQYSCFGAEQKAFAITDEGLRIFDSVF